MARAVVAVTVGLVRFVPRAVAVAGVEVDLVLLSLVAVGLPAVKLVAGRAVPVVVSAADA